MSALPRTITLTAMQASAAGLPEHEIALRLVVTVADFAAWSGTSVDTVRQRCSKDPDRLPPAIRVEGRVYFPLPSLIEWRAPTRPHMRGKWSRAANRATVDAALSVIDAARASARNAPHE